MTYVGNLKISINSKNWTLIYKNCKLIVKETSLNEIETLNISEECLDASEIKYNNMTINT